MKKILMLYRDFGFDTGVKVSNYHLENLIHSEGILCHSYGYQNDEDLLSYVKCNPIDVVLLQAPTFRRGCIEQLLEIGCTVCLVIHSTISFLQVEEEAFDNVQEYLQISHPRFFLANPCCYEVVGFLSYAKANVIYLPNTYNSIIKPRKRKRNHDFIRIALFCAYRPFKNIMTQITACSILYKYLPIELHLLESKMNSVYHNTLSLLSNMNFPFVLHPQCSNSEMHQILEQMDIGLQVSYSETFSYIIYEHMIHGTPTVSSTTVPFATKIVDFNDAEKIASAILELVDNDEVYENASVQAVETAKRIREENNRDAMKAVRQLLEV
jgi:hypothetical protein